jgi:uncharacterized membrane protein YcaP (DUF421 family)
MSAIYSGPDGLWRILIITLAAYAWLIFILRATGKRTLSKLNAFDLVVTVALGSTLASVMTSKSLPLVEGLLALTLLAGLQYVVAFLAVRSDRFGRLIKAEPTLLLRDGRPLEGAMRRERVKLDELRAAVRQAGAERLDAAEAVVLESDGSLTAILKR